MHRGGKQRRDGTGQPEQTGVVSTSPLTNCDTTSCHTRLNSAVARSRSTGNKLMFARRIWVVWRFSGDTYSRVQSWACTYTLTKLIDDKATKRIEIHCAKIPRDIRYKVRARRRRRRWRMPFERETVGRVNTFERVEFSTRSMQAGRGKVRFVFQFALNLVGRTVAVNSMERSKEEKNYTKYGRERKSSRLIRFILILRVHNCLVYMHERTAAEFVLDTRIDREVER